MKATVKIIVLALALLLLVACDQEAEPAATMDLAGTSWQLSSLNGGLPVAGTAVSLQFGMDGTVAGSDGCNRFTTTYTQDGANLTIDQTTAASTMMACPAPVMEQATATMTALGSVTNFTASGNQLSLMADDQVVATFVAGDDEPAAASEASSDLTDTGWLLSALNGGLLLTGTAITLQFGADGSLMGSSGCNTYQTTYRINGSNIAIDPPAGTQRVCTEPDGIMDQEVDFITSALPSAATFRIDGNTLDIYTANNQVAVLANRIP